MLSPPPPPLVECHISKKEGTRRRGWATRGSKIPTVALAMPTPYCKPICIGSTPAQSSMIPTAAPVAPVSTTGGYDIQYLHAAPSTSLNPLIGGYIFFCSDIVNAGWCEIHTLPPSNSLWNNPFCGGIVRQSMRGGVKSTCCPL
jgi:hypothetical protein